MVSPLLVGAGGLVLGLVGGYYVGGHYTLSGLKAELNILLADAKAEEQAIVARVKSWLAGK